MTAEFHEYARRNDKEVSELSAQILSHVSEEKVRDADMAQQIVELKAQVATLSKDVRDLVDMWQQAKGAVNFMKMMAAVVAGGAAFWAWVSANIAITPK